MNTEQVQGYGAGEVENDLRLPGEPAVEACCWALSKCKGTGNVCGKRKG